MPARHVSVPLQTFASAHDVPLATGECWQPVAGLQLSLLHGFPSSQSGAVPGMQVPDVHVSTPLQSLLSAHEVPFGTGECRQPAKASHVSAVHALPSLQLSGVPLVHVPAWHTSAPSHALPS